MSNQPDEEKIFKLIENHWKIYVGIKNYSIGIGIIIIVIMLYLSILINKYISILFFPFSICGIAIVEVIINAINEFAWRKKVNDNLDKNTLLKMIIYFIKAEYIDSDQTKINFFKKFIIINQKLELNNIVKNVTKVLEKRKSSSIQNNIKNYKSSNIYKIEANKNKKNIDDKIEDWYKQTQTEYLKIVESIKNKIIVSSPEDFHNICNKYYESLSKEYNPSKDIPNEFGADCIENTSSENNEPNNSENKGDDSENKGDDSENKGDDSAYQFISDNYLSIFIKYALLISLIIVLVVSIIFHFYFYYIKSSSTILELWESMNSIVTQIVAILLLKFDINSQSSTIE